MAITSITIENFKGIGDAVTIPIRPITLLFGKNSTGKSTVLQALRYFELVSTHIRDREIKLSGGYTIGLTDFPSLVHRQELDRKIRIRIGVSSSVNWECQAVVSRKEELGGYPVFSFFSDGKEIGRLVPEIEVKTPGKKKEIRPNYHPTDYASTEILNEMIDTMKTLDPMLMLHLGPFRELPMASGINLAEPAEFEDRFQRLYRRLQRWEKGLGAWDALAQDPKLVEKTNHYMRDVLALGYTINPLESDGKFQLHDENNNIDISLSNVGVGIAQVIPVLVGVLDDRSQSWNIGDFIYIPFQRRDIFAVEQPELHLHPAAQVALGDVFIDAVKNGNRTMLIETHSEHLLLRIMRRMRETFEDRIEENRFPVTPDDIAVLFVEWHDSQTIIREMPVNERGELVKAWPGGFFEEDIEEVFA